MNISAVVVLVSDAPPSVSLNCGATNTTAPSSTYMEICDVTISLNVSAWVLILMLAAVRDTSTASSNRSSLRALLSRTSLKPSRKSVSRSNSRRSRAAALLLLRGQPAVLEVEDRRRRSTTMTMVSDEWRRATDRPHRSRRKRSGPRPASKSRACCSPASAPRYRW